MSNDPITAKVVSTHEPERPKFDEAWIVDMITEDGERDRLPNLYDSHSKAEELSAFWTKDGAHARVIRLPSEAEAALAPLYEARDRAAVELAKQAVRNGYDAREWLDAKEAFTAKQQALDAAIAAQKGTG